MRFHIIILLAVFSHYVAAGPMAHHRRLAQHHNKIPRFYNVSIAPSTTEDIKTSTPILLPSPSASSSTNMVSDDSRVGHTLVSTSAEGATSSALAMSESSSVAVPKLPTTATSQSTPPPIVGTPSSRSTTSSIGGTSTLPNAESSASTSGIGGSSTQSHTSASVQLPTFTQPASAQDQSSPSTSASSPTLAPSQPSNLSEGLSITSLKPTLDLKKDIVQLGTSNAPPFAPVTAASNSPTPAPSGVKYPTAEQGNTPMAKGFNQIYKTLNVASTCNANDNNQAVSCISGELAQCQADGTYVLKSCPDGQSCYALPKALGSIGVSVECALPSVAAARLSGASETRSTATIPSQLVSADQSTLGASAVLPLTESVQIPVQRISSVSQTIATSPVSNSEQSTQASSEASSKSQASVARSTGSVQQTSSTLPVPTSPSSSLASTVTRAESSQSSTMQEIASAMAESEHSSNSSTEPAQRPVQTLSSFPQPQVTTQTQAEGVTSPSNKLSSVPAQTESGSPAHSSAASEVTSSASPATTDVGGPLFSIPNLSPSPSQASESQHGKAAKSSVPSPQATSAKANGPSVLAQQQSNPTTSPLPLSPHHAEPDLSTPASSDNGGGIDFIPLGAEPTHSAPVLNQKLAMGKPTTVPEPSPSPTPVPNLSAFGTSIYITVTVTTTAHDHSPSP